MVEAWDSAFARAKIERGFRVRLLLDPLDALADYNLSAANRRVIEGIERIHVASLDELIARLTALSATVQRESRSRERRSEVGNGG